MAAWASSIPRWLAAASGLLLLSLLGGGRLGQATFAVLAALFPVGLILLGVRGQATRPGGALGALAAVLGLTALGVLALAWWDARGIGILGLPLSAWLAGLGFGLAPLLIVVWSHASARPRGNGRE